MMIPGGAPARLVRVHNPFSIDLRVTEIADRLKFVAPTPVVILAGAKSERPGKTMAGIARAAFNTGANVIDSGLGTCIERFCQRKGVPLIGICPEAEVDYPRLNPANRKETELTNGHTHFFTLGKEKGSGKNNILRWGQEATLKFDLARRITTGRKGGYGGSGAPPCKYICVVIGDNEASALADIETAMNQKLSIIVIDGSSLSKTILQELAKRKENPKPDDKVEVGQSKDQILQRLYGYNRVVPCKDNSEDAASIVHLLLTITL
jgi:hypothetical protein